MVLSDGLVEKLPLGVNSNDVLGAQVGVQLLYHSCIYGLVDKIAVTVLQSVYLQGQILRSTCGLDSNCQLFWCLSSAYLTSQV